jgi:hypothetical protein
MVMRVIVPLFVETVKYPAAFVFILSGAGQPEGMVNFSVPESAPPAHAVAPAVYVMIKVFPVLPA